MQLTDTHCHIHEILGSDGPDADEHSMVSRWHAAGKTNPDVVIADAQTAGVTRLICVGCTVADSQLAVEFVQTRPQCWASIGIHPHEAARYQNDTAALATFAALAARESVVAVGECGLDYHYNHSPKAAQENILRFQLELAQKHHLPLIFHIREAFADFWPIFDDYQGLRGVVHSFTGSQTELDQALARGLYIGQNGIVTFTKDSAQLAATRAIPRDRLLLETDAPFLTPMPHRGTICEPKHAYTTGVFLAELRGESLDELARTTTCNAQTLFDIT